MKVLQTYDVLKGIHLVDSIVYCISQDLIIGIKQISVFVHSDKAVNRPKTGSAKVLSRSGRAIDHDYGGRFSFEIGTSGNQSGSRFPKKTYKLTYYIYHT